MPKFLIERNAPGVGELSDRDRQAMAMKSNRILHKLGPDIQWQHSYVSGDKIYCVYIAKNESLIREHSRLGEIPLTNIYPIETMIDPTTGEEK